MFLPGVDGMLPSPPPPPSPPPGPDPDCDSPEFQECYRRCGPCLTCEGNDCRDADGGWCETCSACDMFLPCLEDMLSSPSPYPSPLPFYLPIEEVAIQSGHHRRRRHSASDFCVAEDSGVAPGNYSFGDDNRNGTVDTPCNIADDCNEGLYCADGDANYVLTSSVTCRLFGQHQDPQPRLLEGGDLHCAPVG